MSEKRLKEILLYLFGVFEILAFAFVIMIQNSNDRVIESEIPDFKVSDVRLITQDDFDEMKQTGYLDFSDSTMHYVYKIEYNVYDGIVIPDELLPYTKGLIING